jgi:hypothetical protein
VPEISLPLGRLTGTAATPRRAWPTRTSGVPDGQATQEGRAHLARRHGSLHPALQPLDPVPLMALFEGGTVMHPVDTST